ncbi:MAG TPA: hypothetical protein HA263_07915 [Methanoregulaceae archaeon]|nr:hypothetical protein [Methanoregulaceae archaeon]
MMQALAGLEPVPGYIEDEDTCVGCMATPEECVGCSRRDDWPDEPMTASYPAPFGRDGRLRDSQVRRRAP